VGNGIEDYIETATYFRRIALSLTLQELGIDRLSSDERLRLIEEIWDTLTLDPIEIPQSHREELDRRLAAADADPAAGRPWDEVRARLRGEK
jgi:putative addiction module component (TIGR02574 family)